MTEAIPSFFVYGEPEQQLEPGFFHVETVMARRNLHQGQVKAHKHDQMGQITYWLSGRGTYFIDDKPLDFSAPAVSFVPSGIVHGFSVDPEISDAVVVSVADGALLSIRENTTLTLDRPTMIRGDGDDRNWRRLAELLDIVADEYAVGAAGIQQMLASLVAAVLTQIARLASAVPSPAQPSQTILAMELRRLIDARFRENWSVGQYTDALATTPHLLVKAAKDAFGMPVKELINERRLLEAKRLLLFTVRPLEDIAYEIGFADAAYFSRFFRLRVGEAPSDWRRARVGSSGAG
ncbi:MULTISPECIES: helix-turn-helix domain-containing protein [unclassified Ensifer]|uniref:helix-turn-helix domain-containing protein n=1 Tax=unclassified Ensifer TaxID=2633371 RepID=UPI000812CF81|nr:MULTISPECIES: helix-turn-helix domain-containing protein [unclassified Ensifer]OCP00533.1 AraC family transcriptional regulator [Ensifer sp. LC14]OCP05900.1 AraC family transcriptional regulator [Ensifer sp. LC11]OCP06652.1 AraC family transcriptional regulator [Ensifer sp. LC13]OCP31108.1 AraC family transcriptional regulator [Ensifer sp. LC499]